MAYRPAWIIERRLDERQNPRHDVVRTFFSAFVFGGGLDETQEVVVVNLSVGGMGIIEMPPLERGEELTIELHLGEIEASQALVEQLGGHKILRLEARVAWSDGASRAMGLCFVGLRDEQRALLAAVVEHLQAHPSVREDREAGEEESAGRALRCS
jgi:hypothetical protein